MMNYPLDLRFKIATIGTRVSVTDAGGRLVAYVRKKKFRLKEDIGVYADDDQRKLLFRIKADRMMDFGASYSVALSDGTPIGAVRQEGMRSLWKSTYVLTNASGSGIGSIHEENPWVKVLDGLMEAIPFGDALGGLFFNPAYIVDLRGTPRCAWRSSAPSSRAASGSKSSKTSPKRRRT
ncbi:hypothetical protein GBA63_15530 [Rubrobacter tropicus]|uniref:Scramblase n=1 Tax=Rubrobacter tropicus TaxID=2653851 RepID=A0A6G8QBM6_9ACTN|nr:hypothetical protein [Rubrobacter tropicus]QIN83895.1 hypothetical protein GBA63_15530 [Rubrobacter tropicus]